MISLSLSKTNLEISNLPTMSSSTNMRINILFRNISDNYNEVRGRTFLPKSQSSRASSISSTKSLVIYYERMKHNNSLDEDFNMGDNSPQLSYVIPKEQTNHVSIVADPNNNTINKYILIEYLTSSPSHVDDIIINIQLLYDPNTLMEPEL